MFFLIIKKTYLSNPVFREKELCHLIISIPLTLIGTEEKNLRNKKTSSIFHHTISGSDNETPHFQEKMRLICSYIILIEGVGALQHLVSFSNLVFCNVWQKYIEMFKRCLSNFSLTSYLILVEMFRSRQVTLSATDFP